MIHAFGWMSLTTVKNFPASTEVSELKTTKPQECNLVATKSTRVEVNLVVAVYPSEYRRRAMPH